jgi:hypothetical protein
MLSERLTIHILTADTFGSVKDQMAAFSAKVMIIPRDEEAVNYRQADLIPTRQQPGKTTARMMPGRLKHSVAISRGPRTFRVHTSGGPLRGSRPFRR